MFPYPLVWPPLEEELAPFLKYCKGIVLNAGSGSRNIKLGEKDFGIDIIPENNPDIIADLHRIPLRDESVDTIVNIAVLEHTRYAWIVVQEFYRILRPGGYGIIAVPFLQPQHASPYDFIRFTSLGLRELMEYIGFEVVETDTVHHFGQTIAWLLWEYIQYNIPEESSWHFWETLLRNLSKGDLLGGNSPNTHNTEYIIVRKPGDCGIKQPHYLSALNSSDEKWFLHLLSCPKSRQPLHMTDNGFISQDGRFNYPFHYGKPYLFPCEGEFKLKLNHQSLLPEMVNNFEENEENEENIITSIPAKPVLPKIKDKSPTSAKTFSLKFKSDVVKLFPNNPPNEIAVLVTLEYEGIFKNGGVGTYYKNLAKRLNQQGWYNILLVADLNHGDSQGNSEFEEVKNIFSLSQLPSFVNLSPLHQSMLNEVKDRSYEYTSLGCLFFLQAIESQFPQSKVYVEFHEMSGIGYHSIQGKNGGILGSNCLNSITMHSGHEWVYEANEKYPIDYPEYFWLISNYEQFTFENADLTFFPSHFLTNRVNSYGWRRDDIIHQPNFIPIL